MDEDTLQTLRAQIDNIDRELVLLLSKRAELAVRVGQAKEGKPIYDPARETQVLESAVRHNSGPLPDEALQVIFKAMITACRDIQLKKSSDF